jgi:photosystem II stability/assembly factor-like uncharacterized protein
VAGVPNDPSIIYAAFATGGLWKTEDSGQHWFPLFDEQATLSIGAIAVAPSATHILYVGTGEANIFRASLPGNGIYRSEDGGLHFKHLGLTNTGTIARVIVHPTDPNTVYVAASGNEWTYNPERGIYKTTDGGQTWSRIFQENEQSGCIDIAFDPFDPAIIYASMWKRIRKRWSDPVPEDGDHLYRSSDAGKTWVMISSGLPDTKMTGRIGLAVARSTPGTLYAFVDDHTIKREPLAGETDSYERKVQKVVVGGVIYKSTDRGDHWERRGEVHDFFKPFSGTYGWVFGQIRTDPQDANKIYALGVSMGVSSDGGQTWKRFEPAEHSGEYIHGDNHALWIDPYDPKRIILGNDGGVSTTFNRGITWNNFFDKIPTTQFYTVTFDNERPFHIFGAVQDEGTMSGSSAQTFGSPVIEGQRKWMMAPGGEGTQIQVDPDQSNIIYSSTYYGRLMRSDLSLPDSIRSHAFRQFDVGRIDSLRGEWLAGTLRSKFDPQVVYHGLQHLYRTQDGGVNWERISGDLSYNDSTRRGNYPYLIYHQAITTIAEGDAPGKIYAGTDDGRVWYTPDNGANWKEITQGLPLHKHVARIVTSATHPSRVYVVLNDRRQDNPIPYIYLSDNQGRKWTSITGNLPAAPANVIAELPGEQGGLVCGTDLGIYYSRNRGKNWMVLNGNMPASVSVNDLFIHPRDHKLVVGTYGRGVYILDDISLLK